MSSAKLGVPVGRFYQSIIDDVLTAIRDRFKEEYGDDNILNELKKMWSAKLKETGAVADPAESEVKAMQAIAYQAPTGQHQHQQQPVIHQPVAVKPPVVTVTTGGSPTVAVGSGNAQRITVQQQQAQVTMVTNAARVANAALPASMQTVYQAAAVNQQQQQQQTQQYHLQLSAGQFQLHQLQGSRVLMVAPGAQQHLQLQQQPHQQQQQQQQAQVKPEQIKLPQVDGVHSDSDSYSDLDAEGAVGAGNESDDEDCKEEEQPLNSDDDVSDEDSDRLFETDNIVVCQYDKINRARNKWKFHLKDGIMNLNGKDFVFQKATGEAEW